MFELDMLHIPGFIVITSSHEAVTTPNKLTVKSQDNSGHAGTGIACLHLKI